MTKKDSFFSIKKTFGPTEYKEKNSKFISYIFPVTSSVEAETILKSLRKKYHDSSHVCYAYRLGQGTEDYFRYSDDGEPSQTAGLPILNEIKGALLLNVLLVVVRYFGGTKLGTGGLMRAYTKSAGNLLKDILIIKVEKKRIVNFKIGYEKMGDIMRMIDLYDANIVDRQFNENTLLVKMEIPEHCFANAREYLKNVSSGLIKI